MLPALFFVLALLFTDTHAISACKDLDNNDVPGCSLRVHACQNFNLFKSDTYDISFMDKSVGQWGPRIVNKDKNKAGKLALVGLFKQNYGCNCFTSPDIPSTITIGHCTVTGKLCYFFDSLEDIDAQKPSYKLVVSDTYHNVNVEALIPSITEVSDLINAFGEAYLKFQALPTTLACLDPNEQTQCKWCIQHKQYCQTACDFACFQIEGNCGSSVLVPLGCSAEAIQDTPYIWPPTCGPMP